MDRQQVVCIFAADHDRAVAERIARGLGGMGITIGDSADSAVVILSPAALADADWLAELSRHDAARLIPVEVGSVDPAKVTRAVRQLNWITWTGADDALRVCAAIFAALQSDPARHQLHRALAAEADTWSTSKKNSDLLIQDRRRAQEAAQHLIDATNDPLARSSPTIEAFVAASLAFTKRAARKRRNRWIRRSLAVAMVVFVGVLVVLGLRTNRRNTYLGFLASAGSYSSYQPGRTAILSAGAMLQGDPSTVAVGVLRLRNALPRIWSNGLLGTKYDGPLIAAIPIDDGRRVFAVDYRGMLVSWNAANGLVQWRRRVVDAKLTALDATPDGSLVAALSGDRLALTRTSPWKSEIVHLATPATMVALAPADGLVAVAGTDGVVRTVELGPRHAQNVLVRGKAVLALRQTSDGDALALVRQDANRDTLLDVASNSSIGTTRLPASEFQSGGIGAEGAVAIATAGQIFYAEHGMRLHPTGQAVPDSVEVIQPLPGRRVAFSSAQFGVQLLDTARGTALGSICTQLPAIADLRVAADGQHMVCTTGWMIDLWSTLEFSPIRTPQVVAAGRAPVARLAQVRITAARDGNVVASVNTRAGMHRSSLRIAHTSVSTVAIRDYGGVTVGAAGTRTGNVTEFLISPQRLELLSRWSVPDGSPIVELGWSATGRMLLARTAAGDWWSRPSCENCSSIAGMIQDVRERTHGCYTPPASETLTDETKRVLDLSPCKPPPGPSS